MAGRECFPTGSITEILKGFFAEPIRGTKLEAVLRAKNVPSSRKAHMTYVHGLFSTPDLAQEAAAGLLNRWTVGS
jgi:hypothetical protein